MADCPDYNPDNIFKRFKLVDFPLTYVGLANIQNLDVEVDLSRCAYLKTMCESQLMKFEDARNISASHRAFILTQIDERTIQIEFHPKNECIARAKLKSMTEKRFVFDLRLIRVNDVRCCDNELHAEIGRYYISGTYEYCQISHHPKDLDFGEVAINSKVVKIFRIRNESNRISAKLQFVTIVGFKLIPENFTILPNSSKRLSVTFKPTCLKADYNLTFKIRNPNDTSTEDQNYITYTIPCKVNVIYDKSPTIKPIKSLHKLYERLPVYTYMNKETITHEKRQAIAHKHYEVGKSLHVKIQTRAEKYSTGRDKCCSTISSKPKKLDGNFCKNIAAKVTTYELFNISILPFCINFGNVALSTFGKKELALINNTKYNISLKFLSDNCILYTDLMLPNFNIKLPSFANTTITLYCHGFVEGRYDGTFDYVIDNRYSRKHPYYLQVGNPKLTLVEPGLKFGMVTAEGFVTSVPVRIFNSYNITVNYEWGEMTPDSPFEITPTSGSIPHHSSKMCDVTYTCKATKTKTHEVDFISKNLPAHITTIELNIITRKLSMKFLQPAVVFKDIPLNLETFEKIKLENSSREIALFQVLEPLIPGLTVEPMSGTIKPKTIMMFTVTTKISCVLEFAFDMYIRINNKENLILPVSGNVVEPKIVINPKNIYMARIPSFMITYVPVTFQNYGTVKTVVEILDTGEENTFYVFVANGNEKVRIYEFTVEGGQSKTVFIKVCDVYRREYELFMPFRINGLLGPPNSNSCSTELEYYVEEYEEYYENNPKVKVKSISKEISYCRVLGVITLPWVEFSTEKFEFDYNPNQENNSLEFTMKNISKYFLYVTILTSKLSPHFSLELTTELNNVNVNETNIKFDFEQGCVSGLVAKFHPKGHGKFTATAVMFLDKHMTIPYYNLTFVGKREAPKMTPSTYRLIFPPCMIETRITKHITIDLECRSSLQQFAHVDQNEYLSTKFVNLQVIENDNEVHTILTVEITIYTSGTYTGPLMLIFSHDSGACCDVEVHFSVTCCVLSLHASTFTSFEDNPYPYYPNSSQADLYEYLGTCTTFLEKWLFLQGFRRDLYPIIPDTFHAISASLSSGGSKSKGINVSFLNFVRRIAGPLMKHVRKISVYGYDENFRQVKEIHDTYKEIIYLLKLRGANISVVQPTFLLNYEQFCLFSENVVPKCNADIVLTRQLISNEELFNRLNKQSWIDFILQSYKVFIVDSCFFECICVGNQQRDVIKVLIDWYNEHIAMEHKKLGGADLPKKVITNLTTDLSDGIALASVISHNCTILGDHFSSFCEVKDETKQADVINNTCLIIEAMNQLRLFFPLTCQDLFKPNFLQMLFLSIHLYIVLPMFMPKDIIRFQPPLLRTSSRQLVIFPATQETLTYNFFILNNNRNNFSVEKSQSGENGKKMYLNVSYVGNFVDKDSAVLLIHGYNKTRIFDTYVVFLLEGQVGLLNPIRKCKVTGPLYRPNRVDILISSPFQVPSLFKLYITDDEPLVPMIFGNKNQPQFYIRRLNLIDKEINLSALPNEGGAEVAEHKVYLQMICLSTQSSNSWIWFLSDIGQFFVKVTTQPRWDLPIDSLQSKVKSWPMDPCSCGESCECYRTNVLLIPHRNELMLKALRHALLENASSIMMQIFDRLIESTTGKIILSMLLEEGGTNMSDLNHILRRESTFKITSRGLVSQQDHVTLDHHTDAILALSVTVPPNNKLDKFTLTFTSDCGMDIRTYRIFFVQSNSQLSG